MTAWEQVMLTHWGRVTHICVSELTIIGSDNGLSPERRQAIIWTSAGILLIGPLGTNFSEISIKILIFSFKKMHLKVSSGKWRPFCLGLNVLINKASVNTFTSTNRLLLRYSCSYIHRSLTRSYMARDILNNYLLAWSYNHQFFWSCYIEVISKGFT